MFAALCSVVLLMGNSTAAASASEAGGSGALTPICHIPPATAATLAGAPLSQMNAEAICSSPGAEAVTSEGGPASGGVQPSTVGECGSVDLFIYNAPKEGKGWASFHMKVTMNGEFGYIADGSAKVKWENLDTGAKGKFEVAITNDSPSPAEWKKYRNRYTQKGWVLGKLFATVITTDSYVCQGEAGDEEDITD